MLKEELAHAYLHIPIAALLSLACCSCAMTRAAAPVSAPAPAMSTAASLYDRMVEDTYAHFHLEGLAVGVIEQGKVVYVRTLGERVVGSGEKIDADTLFKIGSNSKAMTTALLGRLVDQGKLHWDDPVTTYLRDFRMHDPWVTQQMRVADLLTHSSGLRTGAGDLMLWPDPNSFTRADVIHALRYFKPAYGFRSKYEYDNLLYVVAGAVAEAAGGAPYATLMHEDVFAPLGLHCQVGHWDRDAIGNVAEPHGWINGRNQMIRADGSSIPAAASDPAGGIRCSLNDMLAWARNWLAPTSAELAWLSPAQREVLQAPHMLIPVPQRLRQRDHTHVMAYGYGWRMADADGHWIVWHTGTLAGMYSELMLLPDQRSGFVILISGNGGEARRALGATLLKHFTAPGDRRSVADYAAQLEAHGPAKGNAPTAPDASAASPAAPGTLSGYLGVYQDPWLGEASICARDDTVRFQVKKSPRLSGTVMRLGQRYLVHWGDRSVEPDAWMDFHGTRSPSLTMAKLDPHGDTSSDYEDLDFVRKGQCE